MRYHVLISRPPGVITQFRSSRRYCHPWLYQAAFATGQGIKRIIYIYIYLYIYIYIYTPDQLNAETILDVNLHFLSAVCDLKKCVYFQRLMLLRVYSNRFLRNHTERWFPVYHLRAENFLAFDQIQLDAYRAWSEDDSRQHSNCGQWFLFLKENEMTECPIKPRQPTLIGITWHIQPFTMQSARSVS